MRAPVAGPDAAQALGVALDHLRRFARLTAACARRRRGDRAMALDLALGDAREITSNLAGQVGQASESETKGPRHASVGSG